MRLRSTLLALLVGSMPAASAAGAPIVQSSGSFGSQILAALPAQTFTATDATVETAGVWLLDLNPDVAPTDFSVDYLLYAGAGTTGPLLATKTITGLSPGFDGFATVGFDSLSTTIGATYTLAVRDDTPRWGVRTSVTDAYSGGMAIFGTSTIASGDLRFHVNAFDAPVDPVPEPGSLLLVGSALGGLAYRKRKAGAARSCKGVS